MKEKIGIGNNVFPVRVVIGKGSEAHEEKDDSESSVAAKLEQKPITTKVNPKSLKRFMVYYDKDESKFDIWNDIGGNKTAKFFRFRIAEIG